MISSYLQKQQFNSMENFFCNEKYESLFLQLAIMHYLCIAQNFHYAYAITWHYALRSIIVIPVQ